MDQRPIYTVIHFVLPNSITQAILQLNVRLYLQKYRQVCYK